MRRQHLAIAAVVLVALLAAGRLAGVGAAWAATPDLDQLLTQVALKGTQDVAFEERRYLGALTTPLLSRGHLRFEPPDRLIKRIESPRRETAVADRDRLAVLNADGNEVASLDLDQNPDLRLIFAGLRGVLSGDATALRAAFNARLEDDGKTWRLLLTPKEEKVVTRLKQIVVAGTASRIERFEIHERGGDRSLIQLLAASPRP